MDALSDLLNSSDVGCSVNSCKTNHLLYADDSVLLAPSPTAMQHLINICEKYAAKYELTFNVKKTKGMCFKPKSLSKLNIPVITLNRQQIEFVSSHVYLGVVIQDSYIDNLDLGRQTKSIYGRGNILIKKFAICDDTVKVKLFKAYCSSFYCSQLWSSYCSVSYRKLKTSYNRIVRNLFKLERECSISAKCIELNIDCFEVVIRKSIFSFRSRLFASDNVILQSLCSCDYFYHSNLTKCWNNLLFKFNV